MSRSLEAVWVPEKCDLFSSGACVLGFPAVLSAWKWATEGQPHLPHLYDRVQGSLRGPGLAVILHQAGGHEAEATE